MLDFNIPPRCSFFLDILTFKNGNDKLSGNAGTELPLYGAQYLSTAHISDVRLVGNECTLMFITFQKQHVICLFLSVTSEYKGQHAAPKEPVMVLHTVRDWSTKNEYHTLICVMLGDGELYLLR